MSTLVFPRNAPEIDRINTSAGNVEMFFVGHGSLMFKVNNYVIHIDPVRSMGDYNNLPKADLILVTHDHYDHLDRELIEDLRKPNTLLFSNQSSAEAVSWAQAMKEGDRKAAGDFTIEAVPAYNIKHERAKGQPFHPKGVGIGYILSIGDKRFYIAGDTENIPEMKTLKNIDVAFLPMDLPYTMTPEMVADAASTFNPKILYPYHYGDTDTGKLKELLKDTDIEIRIRKLN
ncbi:MAG: MBL fold metallo-hydrolase [Bacteroidales bacterium]|nr:MBL fold metallo-hydrolase [Bacteroidales bacterium]